MKAGDSMATGIESSSALELADISRIYQRGKDPVYALHNISLHVERGEVIAVFHRRHRALERQYV